jgi:hypothetical protein
MGIADIVQYEREFPLELKHPKTGKPIGVTFYVKHIDCGAATAVVERRMMPAVLGESKSRISSTLEPYAACVSSWDWGKQEFEDGKGVLEMTPENALYVLETAHWIGRAVMDASSNIGNFTKD